MPRDLIVPLVIFTVLLAAALDVLIMSRLRRSYIKRTPASRQREGSINIFGAYSPVLTWIHRAWVATLPAAWNRLRKSQHFFPDILQDRNSVLTSLLHAPVDGAKSSWKDRFPEWLFIFMAVLAFCLGFLDFRPYRQLPGNESLLFQSLDWVFINSLSIYQKFPLWNPYFYAGVPYIADPTTHILNPVVLIPVLIFGVDTGFKLAILSSFFIAAFGMWRLGSIFGLSTFTRIWMTLLFTFAGQPAARFFQGQYLFVLGFAWIPWITGSLILLSRHRRLKDLVGAAAALAILFFSGNIYYQIYMAAACVLFAAIFLPSFSFRKPFLRLDKKLFGLVILTGLLALGFAAVQLFPTIEFAEWIRKGPDIQGSHTLKQIILDLTSKDSYRQDAYSVLPAREEFYAYIGWFPILSLTAFFFALGKKELRKLILFFGMLLLFTILWINITRLPFNEMLLEGSFFHQLRHLLRILVFTSFAVICVAALGLDAVINKLLGFQTGNPEKRIGRYVGLFGQALAFLLIGAMFFSAYDVYSTNKKLLTTHDSHRPGFLVMGWMRQYDNSLNYIRFNPHNSGYDFAVSNNQRLLEPWYHYNNIHSLNGNIFPREISARPNYLIQGANEPVDYSDAEFLREIEGYSVYRLTESLPFVFSVSTGNLQETNAGRLRRQDVEAISAYSSGPNTVEVIDDFESEEYLILLISNYPGWVVDVDGKPADIVNIGGYLGVKAATGVHKYEFSFRPIPFYGGLAVSLMCLGLSAVLLISDQKEQLVSLPARLKSGLIWVVKKQHQAVMGWKDLSTSRPAESNSAVEQFNAGGNLAENAELFGSTAVTADSTGRITPRSGLKVIAVKLISLLSLWGLEKNLFILALLLYLATRFINIVQFPIYFFTDEAIQTVMAADFVRDGFKNYNGESWPIYFSNGSTYNLSSISVYLQVIPYLLFGKSVTVTRGVSVLIGLLAAVFVSLILKNIFRIRYWWVGALLLSITPAWFLHSRTAFETVEMVGFYTGFLYFYMLYLNRSPKYLYISLVFGALVFYTYSPGQLIIGLSGLFLLISDLPYHIKNRKTALRGFLLLILLAMPYISYIQAHPDVTISHLSTRAPFWTEAIPISEKLAKYFSEYLYGLSPAYWFIPNSRDLNRHLMDGYGHIMLWTLPFAVLGLLRALKEIGKPAYRAILIAALVAPSGAALVGIGVTRALVFVIPASILTAVGVSYVLEILEKPREWLHGLARKISLLQKIAGKQLARMPQFHLTRRFIALTAFTAFLLINSWMVRDALINGPTWYSDYTLYGLQYGASQMFGKVNEYLAEHPESKLMVSPNWTNGADAVAGFFIKDRSNVTLGSVTGHIGSKRPLDEKQVFVMMKEEYDQVLESEKFKEIFVEEEYTVMYPNGEPGFYFVRLAYQDNIDQIFEKEREVRKALLEEVVVLEENLVPVRYPHLDSGEIANLFDGDTRTYARTMEANPFVIELEFTEPTQVSGVTVVTGSIYGELTAIVSSSEGEPEVFVVEKKGSVSDPQLQLEFGTLINATRVRLEVREVGIVEPAHIHIWEVEFMH